MTALAMAAAGEQPKRQQQALAEVGCKLIKQYGAKEQSNCWSCESR